MNNPDTPQSSKESSEAIGNLVSELRTRATRTRDLEESRQLRQRADEIETSHKNFLVSHSKALQTIEQSEMWLKSTKKTKNSLRWVIALSVLAFGALLVKAVALWGG
jgi:hypothetical protein